MQTFLPSPDFILSAKSLDRQRLGKQRVEGVQILRTILGKSEGWKNHPAVKMWKNYPVALGMYTLIMCDEWISRGYKDTCVDRIVELLPNEKFDNFAYPKWLGNKEFHLSHQSNLIRKFPEYYEKQFPGIPNNLPYVWPV